MLLEAGRPADARAELDDVIARNPALKSPEGHLVYARAVAALGDRARAHEEFGVLVGYFAGLEARARYAEVLQGWGDGERLGPLLAESLRIARRMPGATRDINREWIDRLRKVEAAQRQPA